MSFDVIGADSQSFTVTIEGKGHPVVVLHPGSSNADSWARVSARLADQFQVLRFDRYTYRRVPDSGFGVMEVEVADVLAVADLHDEPPILVGHSSGGIVAPEAALAAPSRVAGLVLYEPPVAVDEPLGGAALEAARAALDAGEPGRAVSIFLRDITQTPRPVVTLRKLIIPMWLRLRSYAAAQIADTEAIEGLGVGVDRYRGVDIPALLITGRMSPKHLRSRIEALGEALPQVEHLVTIRRGGHGMHISRPATLAGVISGFADRVLI